jgi:hypothetical protein
VRLEGLGQLKNPVTSSGIKSAIFRLVSQCHNSPKILPNFHRCVNLKSEEFSDLNRMLLPLNKLNVQLSLFLGHELRTVNQENYPTENTMDDAQWSFLRVGEVSGRRFLRRTSSAGLKVTGKLCGLKRTTGDLSPQQRKNDTAAPPLLLKIQSIAHQCEVSPQPEVQFSERGPPSPMHLKQNSLLSECGH